jgi:hypothetical protein
LYFGPLFSRIIEDVLNLFQQFSFISDNSIGVISLPYGSGSTEIPLELMRSKGFPRMYDPFQCEIFAMGHDDVNMIVHDGVSNQIISFGLKMHHGTLYDGPFSVDQWTLRAGQTPSDEISRFLKSPMGQFPTVCFQLWVIHRTTQNDRQGRRSYGGSSRDF